MPFPIRNIIAAVAFAFVAIVSWDPCAAGQQLSKIDDRVRQADHSNPLRPTPISDLRSGQIESKVVPSAPSLFERSTNPLTHSLAPRLAERPAGDPDRSFFEQDQPPVVVVWANSDLHNSVVSKRQLRQWMRSGPGRGDPPKATRIDTWQADSASRIQTASFTSPGVESPLALTRSEQLIKDFADQLSKIQSRLDTKKKQLADESSGDDDGSSGELNNLWNLARDWAGKASSNLEKLKTETKKKEAFETEFKIQEEKLATEKEASMPGKLPKRPALPPSDLGEALDIIQKDLKELQGTLQEDTESRREIRERITARDLRVTELPGLLRKIAKEEDETKDQIDELKGKAGDDLSRSLQELLLDAKLLSLEITEKSFELDVSRQEQLGRILPLKLEEITLKIKRETTVLADISDLSDKLRDQEIEERLNAANEALKNKLTQSTPKLKELAEYNKDLASQQTSLAQKSDELESELNNVRQLQEELDESHERIKEQIDTLGPTASGIRLVEHRRSLISTGKSQNRLLELAERLQFKQTRKLQLKERLEQLVLGDNFKIEVLAAVEQQVPGPVQRQMAVDVADHLLETQKKYAEDLEGVFEDNIKILSDLESAHKTLIDKVQEAKAFSDKNALWVRSAKPIAINDLNLCQKGLQSILVSDQWRNMVVQASANFNKHPYHAGLLALVIGSLLVVRRRLGWSHE